MRVICFFVFNSLYLAAQMWCLGKFLPLLIGSLVPEDDEHWQLFQILLEIADLVFSPMITERSVGVLEGLIEEHHLVSLFIPWQINYSQNALLSALPISHV